MRRGARAAGITAAVVLVAAFTAGCGSSKKHTAQTRASSTTTSVAVSAASTSAAKGSGGTAKPGHGARPTQIAVMTSQFGRVLNAPGGHALYVFTQDKPGQGSTCYGQCAKKRPPFLVRRTPQARDAVKQGLLGTTRRRDGRVQATYAGRPLYFYLEERDPGEVLSEGVSQFGGTWWVVAPSGKPVKAR